MKEPITPSRLFESPLGSVILKLTLPLSKIVENLKSLSLNRFGKGSGGNVEGVIDP